MIFKVKRPDGRPSWRVVYDHAQTMSPGDTVSYDALMGLLEANDKHVVYSAVAGANKHLWKDAQRSLRVVSGTGYKLLLPLEHEEQSNAFRIQGKRKIKNALAVMKATDVSTLTGEQQNWVVKLVSGLSLMAAAVDAHAAKLAAHETLLKSLTKKVAGMDELTKRVEKIEGGSKK